MIGRAVSVLRLSVLLAVTACATPVPDSDVPPGHLPAPATDEASFWMVTDKAERMAQTAGNRVTDPALNAYVKSVLCRVAPDYCDQVRVYVMRRPLFNAGMMANGAMFVWTGLLLRARNEAQLAFVIGHELGHYLRRHTLARMRAVRARADATAFADIAMAVAGAGFARAFVHMAVLGSLMAYSRDQEREADDLGYALLLDAGYDGGEAPLIWDDLAGEHEAGDWPSPLIFFGTHPDSAARAQTLRAKSAPADGEKGRARFLEETLRFRDQWLRDELRLRNFGSFGFVLDRLSDAGHSPGLVAFYRGEMYRLRGEAGDLDLAFASYRAALGHDDVPAACYRSLGLLHRSHGDDRAARDAFQTYLAKRPDAPDRLMIETYLAEGRSHDD